MFIILYYNIKIFFTSILEFKKNFNLINFFNKLLIFKVLLLLGNYVYFKLIKIVTIFVFIYK